MYKINNFFKRLLFGLLDLFPIYLIPFIFTIKKLLNDQIKTIQNIILYFLVLYLICSIIWMFPLIILQKKKINLGSIINLKIVDFRNNGDPKYSQLIKRYFILVMIFFPLTFINYLIILLTIIAYFLIKNNNYFLWDYASNTSVVKNKIST